MKVFYHAGEQAYRPAHSFFNGAHVPSLGRCAVNLFNGLGVAA